MRSELKFCAAALVLAAIFAALSLLGDLLR